MAKVPANMKPKLFDKKVSKKDFMAKFEKSKGDKKEDAKGFKAFKKKAKK